MMASENSAQPPSLDYATPSTDARILFTRRIDGATVVIRRPDRQMKAAIETTVQFAVEGLIVVFALGGVVFYFAGWLAIPAAATAMLLVFALAWLAHYRLGRPTVIELTPGELLVSNLD